MSPSPKIRFPFEKSPPEEEDSFHFVCVGPISRVLSKTAIYLRRPLPIGFGKTLSLSRATRGYVSGRRSPCGVASDRVYSGRTLPYERVSSYLAFPSLPVCDRRFISVALSRWLPTADVIRYPALRSPDFPHGNTFRQHTARPFGPARR